MTYRRPTLKETAKFSLSYSQWLMIGKPVRSPERMREIFAICETCDEYRPGEKTILGHVGLCNECGCYVSPTTEDEINKIAWPHEGCPLKKWFPEVREHDAG